MQQATSQYGIRSKNPDDVFIVSRAVYNALHPMDQLIAQALVRVGKVRILDEDEPSGRGVAAAVLQTSPARVQERIIHS